ncbi:hypothetical protein [Cellulosimicrobium cellulans]|jgi:hypothetical protein|uniref:Uncharacterized protein n=1 Tax=Cellulosimicrobium cellulans TaxID=1710 RepID=A0A4Y4E1A4_CELCE|nr:hypothetical protein [Cellulosimicrobium cellulans]GED09625.1 hypothetical protein CCE02nite_16240 [Cellulosimicrobium cellulans]
MTQRSPATETRTRPARLRDAHDDPRRTRRPNLERQSISFTVGLYLFIAGALLVVHVTAGGV